MVKHCNQISAVLTLGPPLAGIFVSDFLIDTSQIATLLGKSLSSNLAFRAHCYYFFCDILSLSCLTNVHPDLIKARVFLKARVFPGLEDLI